MSVRIGLALSDDAVRAVVVSGRRVQWVGETPIDGTKDLAGMISSLLIQVPRARFGGYSLRAALGPQFSQVKILHGLPQVGDPELIESVVRESTGTFFRDSASGLLTTGVRPLGPGSAMAAALHLDAVSAVGDACRSSRIAFERVVPSAVALPRVFVTGTVVWSDGRIVLEIHCADAQLESVRAKLRDELGATGLRGTEQESLSEFPDVPFRFADAIGATLVSDQEPLSLNPATVAIRPGDLRRRDRVQVALACLGFTLLVLSPLASTWAGIRASSAVSEVSPEQWLRIEAAMHQLDYTTRALSDLREFSESRTSASEMLASVSRALPQGSVLLDFEATELGVQMAVLSEDVGAVVSAVRRLPALSNATLLGPPSREMVANRLLYRGAIRSESIPDSTRTVGTRTQ